MKWQKKTKIRHWAVLVEKLRQKPVVLRFLLTSKRALSYTRIAEALLFFMTQLPSNAEKFSVLLKCWRPQDINIEVVVTSFANRTFKSSGTKTPITFLSKSALTSSIVLTRILYTIALTEKKNKLLSLSLSLSSL